LVTLDKIRDAAGRIGGKVHVTPVVTSTALEEMIGRSVFFICDLFQKTGSLKARGTCNAIHLMPEGYNQVVAHSSGNHAQALAWAAKSRGLKAHVVMPQTAPTAKVAAARGYGAEVTFCEPTLEARRAIVEGIMSGSITGARSDNSKNDGIRSMVVQSSNNPTVICGQGTVGLEFVEQ
ncbi:unnamed protein product, partial [Discosporangium mesarthrocarpum]